MLLSSLRCWLAKLGLGILLLVLVFPIGFFLLLYTSLLYLLILPVYWIMKIVDKVYGLREVK